MRRQFLTISLVVISISATSYALGSSNDNKLIYGCVDKKTGSLRISNNCNKNERVLAWNQQGIQGEVGAQGPQGEVGAQGPQGDVGPQGVPGNNGLPGEVGPPGPRGAKGDSGPQGIQGVPGSSGAGGGGIMVRDANNNLVGYAIDLLGNSSSYIDTSSASVGITQPVVAVRVWMPRLNNFLSFYLDGSLVEDGYFSYESYDCTGTPYIPINDSSLSARVGLRIQRSTTGVISWWKPNELITEPEGIYFTFHSSSGGGACQITGYGVRSYLSWQPAANPLADFTIVGPLHFSMS